MKKVILIAGSEATRLVILNQLDELFEGSIIIESYSIDAGINERFYNSVVVLSTSLIYEDSIEYIDASCTIIISKRSLNPTYLDKVYSIPENSSLLVVNDAIETSMEVIELFKQVGFVNYTYTPFYPGCNFLDYTFDYIVTPGETAIIPKTFNNVIGIGSRILDITTIVEILNCLEILDEKVHMVSARYMKKIISQGKELHTNNKSINTINEFLIKLINSVNDGIVSYDREGNINLINASSSSILKLSMGLNIFNETKINYKKLYSFLSEEFLEDYLFEIGGTSYLFSKFFNESTNSYLLTIKDIRERINLESTLKKELKRQGYYGKHTFNNLIYKSQVMRELISRSRKLADSEYNILIFGESGTGKELFASAIHNDSKRKNGPFLAVNCSSLPDELIESELFGYEEGAFTGAKKGGKVGLFELSDGGTIFLDEIGDISLKIQSRLLRVLQEKEILKVGGSKIIPIDVRVIAATNKNLSEMVKKGLFREDLYYRLKKLYINIPPIRERTEDILPLFNHFMLVKNSSCLSITDVTKEILNEYKWPGNVREIENTVEYVLAINEDNIITSDILPEDLTKNTKKEKCSVDNVSIFILNTIKKYNETRTLIGRKKLSELSYDNNYNFTEQQIRRFLDNLHSEELITKERGKVGLRLTEKGEKFCVKSNLNG